jgi:hypothetical protein
MEKKKLWLYLDDVRIPNDDRWQLVKNYDEFVSHIRLNGLENYEVISLDHDLGDTAMREYFNNVKDNYTIDYNNISEKTGYDCCKWLVNQSIDKGIDLPQVYVHSANPIGAGNMMGYINNYYKNCGKPMNCSGVNIPHTYETKIAYDELEKKHKK